MRSGHGGAGAVSFRREKYVPRGGPDGGDGGRGGDVVFAVNPHVKTLTGLRMHQSFLAEDGRSGAGRQRDGARGSDAVIEVPPGTVVRDWESGEMLLDLTDPGERSILFAGGRGGKGNHHFRSSRHQAPRFAQPGEPGVEMRLRVELQVIADIGFVGRPNIGKSTLLKVLTAARPKIGNYPFTTVIPNLGVMAADDRQVVLADIPGIIEGAHEGAGLGLQFLRHVERTRALAYVVDSASDHPAEDLAMIRDEVGRYLAALLHRPSLVIVTRRDLIDTQVVDRDVILAWVQSLQDKGTTVVVCSGATGQGIDELRAALFDVVPTPGDERV